MITRIVKMTFRPELTDEFISIFRESRDKIRHFEGCTFLELWRSEDDPRIFFTHSRWQSAAALQHYRESKLFRTTWEKTRDLFEARAEAWSVKTVED